MKVDLVCNCKLNVQQQSSKMVAMKYFCFCFPVRFGVVVVSCLCIIQALVPIALFLVWDAAKLKEFVRNFQENIGDYSSNFVFDRFLEIVENCN